MNKLVKILAGALIALSLGSSSALADYDHRKESLVALEDSIPFGYNLGDRNDHPAKASFPYLIGDEADLRVRNLGVPGWQTHDLLAALDTNKKFRQAVRHADYVTLNIGNNDFLETLRTANAESGGDPELFQQLIRQKLASSDAFDNLAAILQELRSLTDSPIVLYTIYNPFQLTDQFHQLSDLYLPQINASFAEIADSFSDISLADADQAFGDDQAEYVILQDIHPTVAGQSALAEIGLEALCLNTVKH